MQAPLLSIQNLVSGYGKVQVLHGISLNLPYQGITAVIGPNGHGKSTLLRTISGLNKIWSGSVEFSGTEIPKSTHDIARLGIVHVPQGDQLFMDMTVEENLMMGAYGRSDMSLISQSLEKVFELFPRLQERRNQRANSLSGGERRMTGIGRGMMANGRIMMIDEPSLGLAPLIIEQIYEALSELAKTETAILVVEENPSRVETVASEFYLLDGGNFAWNGTASDLIRSHDVVKTYLGG